MKQKERPATAGGLVPLSSTGSSCRKAMGVSELEHFESMRMKKFNFFVFQLFSNSKLASSSLFDLPVIPTGANPTFKMMKSA